MTTFFALQSIFLLSDVKVFLAGNERGLAALECGCEQTSEMRILSIGVYRCPNTSCVEMRNGVLHDTDRVIKASTHITYPTELLNGLDMMDGILDGGFDNGGMDGEGAHLYVLDTGILCDHEAFDGTVSCDGLMDYFPGDGNAPPPPPPALPGEECLIVCSNECVYQGDGYCDDGGENSILDDCLFGTDCADCGPRCSGGTTRSPHFFYDGHVDPGVLSEDRCADRIALGQASEATRSHGTHVTSIATGVAHNVKLHSIRVLSCDGFGSLSSILWGMATLLEHKVNANITTVVAVASLGVPASGILNYVVDNLHEEGVVFVTAAGNEAQNAGAVSPASAEHAFTVGAVAIEKDGAGKIHTTIASFSNYGRYVDMYAPGVTVSGAIVASTNSYMNMSGTSMAAPFVAGAALQVVGRYPSMEPDLVYDTLRCAADKKLIYFVYAHYSSKVAPLARAGNALLKEECSTSIMGTSEFVCADVRAAYREAQCCSNSSRIVRLRA